MHIELTDHLRCPADHPEAYLVLIPDRMVEREVRAGLLGCPVCQAEYPIRDGVVDLGAMEVPSSGAGPVPDAAALHAFLGLEGAGGFLALIGECAREADALTALLPGVHLALVNPPAGTVPGGAASVLRAARVPFKAGSLRGVVVSLPWAAAPGWIEAAVAAVLPGLRATGEGEPPAIPGLAILGAAGGWWVGRRTGG